MRIESDFHDYYDSLQSLTPGDPDVWHREMDDIQLERTKGIKELPYCLDVKIGKNSYKIDTFVVLFCGKLCLGVGYSADYGNTYYAYGKENIIAALGEEVFNKLFKGSFSTFSWKQLEEHFTEQECLKYHLKYNSPIILIERSSYQTILRINPQLKKWHFQKVVDPYTAFQEIDMFRNSALKANERPMVSISDKDKIHKHGFDKWSFRKQPENYGTKTQKLHRIS